MQLPPDGMDACRPEYVNDAMWVATYVYRSCIQVHAQQGCEEVNHRIDTLHCSGRASGLGLRQQVCITQCRLHT